MIMLDLNKSSLILSSAGVTLLSGEVLSSLSRCPLNNRNNENNDNVFKNNYPLSILTRGVIVTGVISIGASNLIKMVSLIKS